MLFLEHAMQKFNLNKNIAKIHSIETFGSVDGPGVRFVVFLNGCHMRCKFCHNPDTWDINGGEERTADELLTQALKYKTYWKSGGGITVSGGEPLIQIDFLNEFFKKAKAKGVHVTLDTSGNPFTREEPFFSKFKELMNVTDLVILDIKEIDECRNGVIFLWNNGRKTVRNELDVIAVKDSVPICISCKDSDKYNEMALNELNVYANKIGGKNAYKILVATKEPIKEPVKMRAKEMGIHLVIFDGNEEKFINKIRKIIINDELSK